MLVAGHLTAAAVVADCYDYLGLVVTSLSRGQMNWIGAEAEVGRHSQLHFQSVTGGEGLCMAR